MHTADNNLQDDDIHNHGVSDIAENTFLKSEPSGSTRSDFYGTYPQNYTFPSDSELMLFFFFFNNSLFTCRICLW